eukprot:IDg7094t1
MSAAARTPRPSAQSATADAVTTSPITSRPCTSRLPPTVPPPATSAGHFAVPLPQRTLAGGSELAPRTPVAASVHRDRDTPRILIPAQMVQLLSPPCSRGRTKTPGRNNNELRDIIREMTLHDKKQCGSLVVNERKRTKVNKLLLHASLQVAVGADYDSLF